MLADDEIKLINNLPKNAQQQVVEFAEFLANKQKTYPTQTINVSDDNDIQGIESSFGLVTVNHNVSLEDIQQAIEEEGGRL
ncbi:DUF2281 domain-containing protein [Psychrobacter sp. I-STPA10]|uniref:DUF2281 domain-containing protein n=1 Tax=Psychrobacter sp. I-STPA10 TaxID=2585769 RepID=UPI001E4FCFEC|nr:DUF2281 domain-containing protein [Psychrobacter sp. I-STPA10]